MTFLVTSDTHFGYGYDFADFERLTGDPRAHPVGIEASHAILVPKLNAMAGISWPQTIGGAVAPPRGLLITGDLTEWGRPAEWTHFVAWYGLRGTEGPLKMPVFEVVGNHDKVQGAWVEQRVAARHGGRFYAWDWDDLHVVALGEAEQRPPTFLERVRDTYEGALPLPSGASAPERRASEG